MKKTINFFGNIAIVAVLTFSMIACSSPESDGKKAGKKVAEIICECNQKYPIDNEEWVECHRKGEEYFKKIRKKYATSEQKLSEFEFAFNEVLHRILSQRDCYRQYFETGIRTELTVDEGVIPQMPTMPKPTGSDDYSDLLGEQ